MTKLLMGCTVTPSATKSLVENGYTVNVERSPARIFKDEEFEAAGATLVPEGSWVSQSFRCHLVSLTQVPAYGT